MYRRRHHMVVGALVALLTLVGTQSARAEGAAQPQAGNQVGLGAGVHATKYTSNGWTGLYRWKASTSGFVAILDIIDQRLHLVDEVTTTGTRLPGGTLSLMTTDSLGHPASATTVAASPTDNTCSCQDADAAITAGEAAACLAGPIACGIALGTGEQAKNQCENACSGSPPGTPPSCQATSAMWFVGTYSDGSAQFEAVDDLSCQAQVDELYLQQNVIDDTGTDRSVVMGPSNTCYFTTSCENGWYWVEMNWNNCYHDQSIDHILYSEGPDEVEVPYQSSSGEACD